MIEYSVISYVVAQYLKQKELLEQQELMPTKGTKKAKKPNPHGDAPPVADPITITDFETYATSAYAMNYNPTPDEKTKPKPFRLCEDDSKREDKTPMPKLGEAGTSQLGNYYTKTTENDWYYFHAFGWVMAKEMSMFKDMYRQCSGSKKWLPCDQVKQDEDGYYFSDEYATTHGYFMCPVLERWSKEASACTAYIYKINTELGYEPIKVCSNAHAMAQMCDFSKKPFVETPIVKLVAPHGMEKNGMNRVATPFLKTNFFDHCPACDVWFDRPKVLIPSDGLVTHPKICFKCKNSAMQKNVILAHDSATYPDAMPVPMTRWRVNRETGEHKLTKIPYPRMYGVECEVEMTDPERETQRVPYAIEVRAALGTDFVVIKHDGSLGGTKPDGRGGQYGFEIVSAPADISVHKKRWIALLDAKCYKKLRSWDADFCGMHVHVSREAITTLQLGRLLVWINHENNKKFVQKVAGRSELKYCRYVEKHYGNALDAAKGRGSDDERRQAINQQNKKTIEFRIFRGTINPKHIMRNIEFCDAILDFCHPGSRSFAELKDFNFFIKFCSENRKKWPLFCEWLAFHNLIKTNKVTPKTDTSKLTLNPVGIPEHDQPVVGSAALA